NITDIDAQPSLDRNAIDDAIAVLGVARRLRSIRRRVDAASAPFRVPKVVQPGHGAGQQQVADLAPWQPAVKQRHGRVKVLKEPRLESFFLGRPRRVVAERMSDGDLEDLSQI